MLARAAPTAFQRADATPAASATTAATDAKSRKSSWSVGSPESAAKVWMSEPDREPVPKSRGMKKLAGMDLEELRRVEDALRGLRRDAGLVLRPVNSSTQHWEGCNQGTPLLPISTG